MGLANTQMQKQKYLLQVDNNTAAVPDGQADITQPYIQPMPPCMIHFQVRLVDIGFKMMFFL